MFDLTRAGIRSAIIAAALLVATAPLNAQTHRVAIGVTGGWSAYGDLTPGLSTPSEFEPGWIAGGQLELWFGSGRFGARLNGSYTKRALQQDAQSTYELLAGDLSVLARPLPAGFIPWAAPYFTLGGGLAQYRGSEALLPVGGGAYGPDPVTRPIAVAGGGFDLLPMSRLGLRLEVADQVVFPAVGDSPSYTGLPMTHNIRVVTALQYRIGGAHSARTLAERPSEPKARVADRGAAQDVASRDDDVERLKQELAARERELSRLQAENDSLNTPDGSGSGNGAASAAEPGTRTESAPVAARPAAPTATPAARDPQARFTVQVGSFVEPATAERWLDRLRQRELPVWTRPVALQGLEVVRVRIGATATESEARQLAQEISRVFGWAARVEPIDAEDRPPAEAIQKTRTFLSGG